MDLPAAEFSYEEILEKYVLTEESLAELLYKSYQCLFLEKKSLTIVTNTGKEEPKECGRTAREIIWLLHMLLPFAGTEHCVHHKYLSYAVGTTTNVSAVRFVFTEEMGEQDFVFELGGRGTEALSGRQETASVSDRWEVMPAAGEQETGLSADKRKVTPVPEVFRKLSVLALKGQPCAQEFLGELLNQPLPGNLDTAKMDLLYLKWKLDHGFPVSEQEVEYRLQNIMRQVDRSDWHHDFMKKYFAQLGMDELDNQRLAVYWKRVIIPWLNRYDGMPETEQLEMAGIMKAFAMRMYEVNQAHFVQCLGQLPEQIKQEILLSLYEDIEKLQDADIFILLEMDGSMINTSANRDRWLCAVQNRIKMQWDDRIFDRLCGKYARIYELFCRENPEYLEKYENVVWEYAVSGSCALEKCMMFQHGMLLVNRCREGCDVWNLADVSFETFSDMERIFARNPVLISLKKTFSEMGEKSRCVHNCYQMWENIRNGVYARVEIMSLLQEKNPGQLKIWVPVDFIDGLADWILGNPTGEGIENFCYLMYLKEAFYGQRLGNIEKQCELFRQICIKSPKFAETAAKTRISEHMELWENMKLYFRVVHQEAADEKNPELLLGLIEEALCMFGKIPEVLELIKRGKVCMRRLDDEYYKLLDEMEQRLHEIYRNMDEIEYLREKMHKNDRNYREIQTRDRYSLFAAQDRRPSMKEVERDQEILRAQVAETAQCVQKAREEMQEAQESKSFFPSFLKGKK